jgi:hypothetical protein
MAITYEPLASITLTSAAQIVFSSIPQTYTDLVLVTNLKISSSSDVDIILNNDTGTNYSFTGLYETGSSVSATRAVNLTYMRLDYYGYAGTTFGQINIANFPNYANTSVYKSVLTRNGNANNGVGVNACLWRSTSAITSISIIGTYDAGSSATLYGIKAA